MNKKIRYWLMVVAATGISVWSAVQIYIRIKPQQTLAYSEYHWDIFACEVLFIFSCYVLLLLRGKEKSVNGSWKIGGWTDAD